MIAPAIGASCLGALCPVSSLLKSTFSKQDVLLSRELKPRERLLLEVESWPARQPYLVPVHPLEQIDRHWLCPCGCRVLQEHVAELRWLLGRAWLGPRHGARRLM